MSGMSSTNFLMTATMIDDTALPSELNAIWQEICIPNMNITAMYILRAVFVKAISSASGVNIPANICGNSMTKPQSRME